MQGDVERVDTWRTFKTHGDRESRDELILHYLPLVKEVAVGVASGLAQHVDKDDLESYGVFGLIDAIDKFDPARGVRFEAYARPRIRGKIFDELRSVDSVPRLVRSRVKAAERAKAKLEHELHRAPTDTEVAAELGWSEERLDEALRQAWSGRLVPLDAGATGAGNNRSADVAIGDTLASTDAGPADDWELEEKRQRLAAAIGRLPERERVVLSLYYLEGLSFDKIAPILGVVKARLVQIHDKAMTDVRSTIASGAV